MTGPLPKHSLKIASVLLVVALAVASALLWLERRNRFPLLEPGLYAGTINGIFSDDGGIRAPLVMQALDPKGTILISISGQEPTASVLAGAPSEEGATSLLSRTLESPYGALRFIGAPKGDGVYVGTVSNLDSGGSGRWQVELVSSGDISIASRVQERIKLWLKLKEELGLAELEFSQLQRNIPPQRDEIERLSEAVAEGSKLKSSAEEKYGAVRRELEKAQADLQEKQERAKKLEEKLLLAQKVTAAGRLVSLVKQTAEREARWVESMLRVGGEVSSPEVEAALKQGARVIELQAQIERERARINELTAREQLP